MKFINSYITEELTQISSIELATKLNISISMVSSYKKSFNPSLQVAMRVYKVDGIVLHPFAEESLKFELDK